MARASYNQTASVVGSTSAFNVFSVSNFLPGGTGLTLSDITTNAVNGTIDVSGTPTAAGTATFTVTVATTGGNSLTQNMGVTIAAPLSIPTSSSLPRGTAGMNYSQAVTVVGGVLPYTNFTVTSFNAGATGLQPGDVTAQPATGVFYVNGMASAGGTATFTVNVTDSAGDVVTKNFTIAFSPPLIITPSLPAGTAGTNYNQTLTVTGGGGVSFTSLTVGQFNGGGTGLTMGNVKINTAGAAVTIDGTPTAAGTVSFNVNAVDSIGAVVNKTYTITINPGLTMTPSLAQGTLGTNYHQTITIAGGSTPYTTFTITGFSAGTTGLSASTIAINPGVGTIVVNGAPNAVGTATFTVNVTDAVGSRLSHEFTITINAPPTLGNLTATQWTAGASGFTGVMNVANGTGPFTIAHSSGLPSGLIAVVSGNTIRFTGTPTAVGTFAAGSITLVDAAGASVSKSISITINAAPAIGNLTTTQWTAGISGFVSAMTVAGGTGGLSIASSTGLPTGVTAVLSGGTIRLTGTPTAKGTFTGSVTLRDAVGATIARTFTITINAPPTLGNLTTTQWTAGAPGFGSALTITGGTGPFSDRSFQRLTHRPDRRRERQHDSLHRHPDGRGNLRVREHHASRRRRRQRHQDLQHYDQSPPGDHDHQPHGIADGRTLHRGRPGQGRHRGRHLRHRFGKPASGHEAQQRRRHHRRFTRHRLLHGRHYRHRRGRRHGQPKIHPAGVLEMSPRQSDARIAPPCHGG